MTPLNRRTFIQSALTATGGLALTRGSIRAFAVNDSKRTLLPVKVSRDRLIRTVVGLRPYRPEGFRIEAEKLGNKLLVHHYGHGGAGITLSWGSAHLALEVARDFRQNNCAVLGCGVIGLSTARLFQRRGGSVTIYAKDLPPETTSNIAGGFWYPTSVYEGNRTTAKFMEQFLQSCARANRAFQLLAGPEYGVRWIDTFELQSGEATLSNDMPGGAELYPDNHRFDESKKYFGLQTVRQFSTMLIEPQTYLNALLRDFYVAGGKVTVREFQNLDEIAQLQESLIFNCTGLGAKKLVGDPILTPVRGQLEILLPQPEIDYCYVGEPGYMFPRRDGIVLGGTFEHDVWSLEPNSDTTVRILDNHTQLMKRIRK
jgi:glycine/D-amino acid oxidase-like deaminating enzyme